MVVDEAIFDEARRYAIALLAEGRERLRDAHPSVPGPLAAEVFWYIETQLPHLSRCALEKRILGEDNNGAGWRNHTVARGRTEDETQCWKSWAKTRRYLASAQAQQNQRALERRDQKTGDELLEIQPIFPARVANEDDRFALDNPVSKPLMKGRVTFELHCEDRLRLYKDASSKPTNASQQTAADNQNDLTNDQITGPLQIDVQCHLSDSPCLSIHGCQHRTIKGIGEKTDGSPITFRRLYYVLFEAHACLADFHRQQSGDDEYRLERLLNWQRAALLSQVRMLSAWRACHRVLRRKLLRGEKFQIERETFEKEYMAIEKYYLQSFQ